VEGDPTKDKVFTWIFDVPALIDVEKMHPHLRQRECDQGFPEGEHGPPEKAALLTARTT